MLDAFNFWIVSVEARYSSHIKRVLICKDSLTNMIPSLSYLFKLIFPMKESKMDMKFMH